MLSGISIAQILFVCFVAFIFNYQGSSMASLILMLVIIDDDIR